MESSEVGVSTDIIDRESMPHFRFWAKVERTDGCWEWTAAKDTNGYGVFWLDGKQQQAHRVAYEMLVGPIPDGMQIDHICANRLCVRHLRVCSPWENTHAEHTSTTAKINAAKTHCPHGHPYSGDNLYVYNGRRECRECRRNRNRECRRTA